MSPSSSTSAVQTDSAPPAVVVMTRQVQMGGEVPLFSYQAIVSSLAEAERTSMSPSLSTSAAWIDAAKSAVVVMMWLVKMGGEAPLFSYQAILSSLAEAERTSRSPSPSTSVA